MVGRLPDTFKLALTLGSRCGVVFIRLQSDDKLSLSRLHHADITRSVAITVATYIKDATKRPTFQPIDQQSYEGSKGVSDEVGIKHKESTCRVDKTICWR